MKRRSPVSIEYKFVTEKEITRFENAVNESARQGWRLVQFYSAPIFGDSPFPFIVVMERSTKSKNR